MPYLIEGRNSQANSDTHRRGAQPHEQHGGQNIENVVETVVEKAVEKVVERVVERVVEKAVG